MQAIQLQSTGGPEALEICELDQPEIGQGEALIRIHAAGVNFIDVYQRRGGYPVRLPYVPGMEGAGIVEAVAPDVSELQVGDRVAYCSAPGTYAQYAKAPANTLIRIPDSMSYEMGAAFPLQCMTAHYLLHEFRTLRPGDNVLIHAAAGGMGLLLVQWAKRLGAHVIGTVSSKTKADAALAAGADHVIRYTEQNFAEETMRLTGSEGAHLVIDGVGKTTFSGDLKAAARRGVVVVYGAASGPAEPISPNTLMARSITVAGGSLQNYILTRDELLHRAGAAMEGIEAGWLKLHVNSDWTLPDAGAAQAALEDRSSIGKQVLRVA